MKHINKFTSEEAYNTFIASNSIPEPNITLIKENNQKIIYTNKKSNYLTFESLEDNNTFNFIARNNNKVYYSLDDGKTWTEFSNSNKPILNNGDTIICKGTCIPATGSSYNNGIGYFSTTKKYNVSGNVMSLLYGDNFEGKYEFGNNHSYAFSKLFSSAKIYSAAKLLLPATKLKPYCYDSMFYQSTLVKAPVLPATSLEEYCYKSMFGWCDNLEIAPTLPATKLA